MRLKGQTRLVAQLWRLVINVGWGKLEGRYGFGNGPWFEFFVSWETP